MKAKPHMAAAKEALILQRDHNNVMRYLYVISCNKILVYSALEYTNIHNLYLTSSIPSWSTGRMGAF